MLSRFMHDGCQWPTTGDEDADVACALVRAAFTIVGTLGILGAQCHLVFPKPVSDVGQTPWSAADASACPSHEPDFVGERAGPGGPPHLRLEESDDGLRPTKGDEDAEKPKAPVAYARGSERGRYRTATVRESVPLFLQTNVFKGAISKKPSCRDTAWIPGCYNGPSFVYADE
jgi:hypothetical protein